MIDLSTVTLLCADCVDAERAIAVLERCQWDADFGAVKLLTSLQTNYAYRVEVPPLSSKEAYSLFMLQCAVDHVETPHCLVVQHDGYVINPGSWDPAWLNYDYIGPLFLQGSQVTDLSVGSGGFSLRSRKLMEYVKQHTPAWDGTPYETDRLQTVLGSYEDGVICHRLRRGLVAEGFKFAAPEVACRFAQGGWPEKIWSSDDRYFCERPFGFHGFWKNIDMETGVVSPPPFEAVHD